MGLKSVLKESKIKMTILNIIRAHWQWFAIVWGALSLAVVAIFMLFCESNDDKFNGGSKKNMRRL